MVSFDYINLTGQSQRTSLLDPGGCYSWRKILEPGRKMREEQTMPPLTSLLLNSCVSSFLKCKWEVSSFKITSTCCLTLFPCTEEVFTSVNKYAHEQISLVCGVNFCGVCGKAFFTLQEKGNKHLPGMLDVQTNQAALERLRLLQPLKRLQHCHTKANGLVWWQSSDLTLERLHLGQLRVKDKSFHHTIQAALNSPETSVRRSTRQGQW